MELERRSIERRDFPSVRKGYDPAQVDQHLREIADAVEALLRSRSGPEPTVSSTAAERVQAIVEAAERSAAEIEAAARREAEEARAGLVAEQAGRMDEVKGIATRLRERAETLESELMALVDEARGARGSVGAPPPEPVAAPREVEALAEPEPPAEPSEPEAEPADAEPEPEAEETPAPAVAAVPDKAPEPVGEGGEGARLIALNMALNGAPRDETARYLSENFELDDPDAVLDDAYGRAG